MSRFSVSIIFAFSFLGFSLLVLSSSNRSLIYPNHLFSISSGSVSSYPSLFWTPSFILVLYSIDLTFEYIIGFNIYFHIIEIIMYWWPTC